MSLAFRAMSPPASLPSSARHGTTPGQRPSLALIEAMSRHATAPAARAHLEALAGGEALAVLAGQQPCFPLPLGLSLLKAASAVALADAESRRLGRPVCAVYWSAGDDSDFQEARGQFILRGDPGPLHAALPDRVWRKGAFVGDLPLEPAYGELCGLKGMPGGLKAHPPRPGEDLGERECRLLAEIFAPWGLLCLDARAEGLRRAAEPIFARYAARRREFAAVLDARGDEMQVGGEERPLRRGIGERALFFLRRRRRSLPEEADYEKRLAARLESEPESLSPNVALRPLVQDALLPVLAAVLGPAEWNYHRQLLPAFELMELAFPRAMPRLRLELATEEAAFPDAGRASSPLARMDHPLADPVLLVVAAREHRERWEAGDYGALICEGE